MSTPSIRVRFAPAPTGLMHLGNVRAALMNYLFAKQQNGTFVLRIEDTDFERNFDPGAQHIIKDLQWLGLTYDEGPHKEGFCGPYFQSQRTDLYNDKLRYLQENGFAYRCFCTQEEIEKKRARQIALKQPPRYDRTCFKRSADDSQDLLAKNAPFIWRMYVGSVQSVTIVDLGHGTMTFDLNHFSDFSLTRQDGSVTFMLANCVDDIAMNISHVFRGEDHLTNTAGQAVLYQAFGAPLPIYWHMAIMCNIDGKKLSKRDFGFSLNDLRESGFLPEAINNYLGITGGRSFANEIMTLQELVSAITFDNMHASGQVKYDVEKLRWVNHKWINQLQPMQLTALVRPFLEKQFPAVESMSPEALNKILSIVKTDVHTLDEFGNALAFYFVRPTVTKDDLDAFVPSDQEMKVCALLAKHIEIVKADTALFLNTLKSEAKVENIPFKALFTVVRVMLTGKPVGPGIDELIAVLGAQEAYERIQRVI
jgi:nondiscriminating glutamyl-tRNA synthetase